MRKVESFGRYHFNKGTINDIPEKYYELDNTRQYYLFDIVPMGAPRMSSSDRWRTNPNHEDINKRQREIVTKYFRYKDNLNLQANKMNFTLGKFLDAVFIIPMPDSWSKKKKEQHNKTLCEVKPDTDNIIKGICDTFRKNDSDISKKHAEKRWGYVGSIIIFE